MRVEELTLYSGWAVTFIGDFQGLYGSRGLLRTLSLKAINLYITERKGEQEVAGRAGIIQWTSGLIDGLKDLRRTQRSSPKYYVHLHCDIQEAKAILADKLQSFDDGATLREWGNAGDVNQETSTMGDLAKKGWIQRESLAVQEMMKAYQQDKEWCPCYTEYSQLHEEQLQAYERQYEVLQRDKRQKLLGNRRSQR